MEFEIGVFRIRNAPMLQADSNTMDTQAPEARIRSPSFRTPV
jgi:hypothetical protein